MYFLKINNTDISDSIASLSVTHEPVWNTKAGRTLTAEFVGRVIARKWKLEFTTVSLSQDDMNSIVSLIEQNDFLDVTFIPLNSNGEPITRPFYINAPTTEVYSYSDELTGVRYKSLSFNIIEK